MRRTSRVCDVRDAVADCARRASPSEAGGIRRIDDVAAATKRAVKLGAELLEDQTRGPAGDYSIVRDPGGATVALWQKA
jgi:predicted enzyme related to lactoylglutathione lyase